MLKKETTENRNGHQNQKNGNFNNQRSSSHVYI